MKVRHGFEKVIWGHDWGHLRSKMGHFETEMSLSIIPLAFTI